MLISLLSSISESAGLCHFPRTKKVKLTDRSFEGWKKEKQQKQPVLGSLPGFADLVTKHYVDFRIRKELIPVKVLKR